MPLRGRIPRANFEVSDSALELACLQGDEVLVRRQLELRRGEVVVVD